MVWKAVIMAVITFQLWYFLFQRFSGSATLILRLFTFCVIGLLPRRERKLKNLLKFDVMLGFGFTTINMLKLNVLKLIVTHISI